MARVTRYTDRHRKADFDYFVKNYKSLYKKYGHVFIAIKDKNILGTYKNAKDAINNVDLPIGSYILQECNGNESGYTAYISSFNLFKA